MRKLAKIFRNRAKLRQQRDALESTITELQKRCNRIEDALDSISQFNQLYKGVPIGVYIVDKIVFKADVRGRTRLANVYKRYNTKGRNTHAVVLHYYGASNTYSVPFTSRKNAMLIAKDWVAFGKRPKGVTNAQG